MTTACALVGATALIAGHVPVAATARTPIPTPSTTTTQHPISLSLHDQTLRYGQQVLAAGRVARTAAGAHVALEHRTRTGAWQVIARGSTSARGAYRLRAVVRSSGLIRIVAAPTVAGGAAAAAAVPDVASRERGLRVAADVRVLARRANVRSGSLASVAGRVFPATSGRIVALQRHVGHGWRTLARTRTRAGGAYGLRYRTSSSFSAGLRVTTGASATVAAGTRSAGHINVLRPALASWYGEGQSLACGGSLTAGMMGVAHRSLPCGTKVTIRYRGRQVRVPVVDRGPYSGGREFDLGPGVRAALGFDGVGTVWVAAS